MRWAQMQQQANAGAPVSLQLASPPAPQKVGRSFQVAVNLSGGQDVFLCRCRCNMTALS